MNKKWEFKGATRRSEALFLAVILAVVLPCVAVGWLLLMVKLSSYYPQIQSIGVMVWLIPSGVIILLLHHLLRRIWYVFFCKKWVIEFDGQYWNVAYGQKRWEIKEWDILYYWYYRIKNSRHHACVIMNMTIKTKDEAIYIRSGILHDLKPDSDADIANDFFAFFHNRQRRYFYPSKKYRAGAFFGYPDDAGGFSRKVIES